MAKIKCNWCRKIFRKKVYRAKTGERTHVICPHCGRTIPSSKIESTGNVAGRKHIHTDY